MGTGIELGMQSNECGIGEVVTMRLSLFHLRTSEILFASLTGGSFSWYNCGCNVHVSQE